MKNKNKILAHILGVYIAILPLSFIFHLEYHHINDVQLKEQQHHFNKTTEQIDCFVCSFYLNERLYFEEYTFVFFKDHVGYNNLNLKPSFEQVSSVQLYLRGPPLIQFSRKEKI